MNAEFERLFLESEFVIELGKNLKITRSIRKGVICLESTKKAYFICMIENV